jgi:hypothetical protein
MSVLMGDMDTLLGQEVFYFKFLRFNDLFAFTDLQHGSDMLRGLKIGVEMREGWSNNNVIMVEG